MIKLSQQILFSLFFILMFNGCYENTRIANENNRILNEYTSKTAKKLLDKEEVRELSAESITQLENIVKASDSSAAITKPVGEYIADSSDLFGKSPDVKPDVTVEDLENDFDRSLGMIDARTKAAQNEVDHGFFRRWQNSKAAIVAGGIFATLTSMAMAYFGISKLNGLKSLIGIKEKESEDNRNVAKINAHYAKNMEDIAYASADNNKLNDEDKVKLKAQIKEKINTHRSASATSQQQFNVSDKMGTILTEVKIERNPK